MSHSKTSARAEIEKLVRYFEQNIHQLKAPNFNEAQARQFLIDPFFEALGWDISNKAMAPPFRLEVLPEGRVKTSIGKGGKDQTSMFPTGVGVREEMKEYSSMLEYIADDEYKAEHKMASKKPDYRFRIQGSTKFFVEAKKPSVDLTNHDSVFQIKRYGFSARVPVSILTDFEDFRVFDCTRKPFYDKPKVGVLKEFDLKYSSYLDSFDLLYDTFSREAVIGGSIEALQKKYLEKKKGEFALDRAFLDDLSEWRVELAQDIAKHPKNRRVLNSFTLNECVQRILDRIVFLRVVQDRNIDPDEELLALTRLWDSHPGLSLYEMFNKLIEKKRPLYNGLLFSPHECEQLEVGNKILEKIFKNINYPLSPYNFDEIGVEILGSIYERFLGKTIRLTQKQVRVEDKPEVRKAGGVYYTPQYIVNYIVENTVGKLIEGKKPSQIAKLKIIDISCGSGSFLLGAFQKLIDYHEQWYAQHPDDVKEVHGVRDVYEDALGRLVLSARKKREILVNNLYGVDIDAQAVEVTQMSLYLKVLENENDATLNKPTMLALHEVLLPPLKDNIKCGNSLIGTDIGAQGDLFDSDATRKINPFDWQTEFREIMDAGGFDCVIGNPPYGADFLESTKDYLRNTFQTFIWRGESYLAFVERALSLLKVNGLFGYIIPDTYLNLGFTQALRAFLLRNSRLREINVLPSSVFPGATVDTTLLFVQRQEVTTRFHLSDVWIRVFDKRIPIETLVRADREFRISSSVWFKENSFNVQADKTESELLGRIKQNHKQLSAYAELFYGIKVYQVGKGKPPQTQKTVNEKLFTADKKRDKSFLPFFDGKHIGRYENLWKGNNWVKYGIWLAEPRNPGKYEGEKILIRKIVGRTLIAHYISETSYCNTLLFVLKKKEELELSYQYLLGILNSQLIGWYFRKKFQISSEDTFPQIMIRDILQLPIHAIDFAKPDEKKVHDDLVKLVEKMLDLQKQLQKASFDSEKEPIERQIESTDRKIDEMVYKLYELTEEEIAIVEGRTTEEAGVEQKWEASFASSQEKLTELASKALKEYKSGKTEKMGFNEL